MNPTTTMRKALADKKLLGNVLVGPSWHAWRVLLIAAMGEALTDEERVIFTALTGRTARAAAAGRGVGGRSRQAWRQESGHVDVIHLSRWPLPPFPCSR